MYTNKHTPWDRTTFFMGAFWIQHNMQSRPCSGKESTFVCWAWGHQSSCSLPQDKSQASSSPLGGRSGQAWDGETGGGGLWQVLLPIPECTVWLVAQSLKSKLSPSPASLVWPCPQNNSGSDLQPWCYADLTEACCVPIVSL